MVLALRRRGMAAFAALALLAGAPMVASAPAAAQPAAPAPKASPAQVALAKELVGINGEARTFDGIIPSIVDGAARFFLQTNPDLVKALAEAAAAVRPQFEKRQGELIDLLAGLYAAKFSEAELKEAIAFYRTPTGQKLVGDRPVIFQEAMRGIQAWGAALNNEAVEAVRAEMRKRGHDL